MIRARLVLVIAVVVVAGAPVACGSGYGEEAAPHGVADGGANEGSSVADSDAADAHDSDVGAAPTCKLDAPFGAARPLAELNSASSEKWGRLTSDELMIVFGSSRPGVSPGPIRFYVARRAVRSELFGTPEEILGVSGLELDGGAGFDIDPAISADGRSLAFARSRGVSADVFISQRASRTQAFGGPTIVTAVSSPSDENQPFLSETGIWMIRRESSTSAHVDILYGQRAGDTYAVPTVVTPVSRPDVYDTMPTPSRDGLVLYFGSSREGARGSGLDVWVARRSPADPAFGAPTLVSEVSTDHHEEPTWISDDGCRLYLHRRVDDTTADDLYVAEKPAN